MYDLNRRSGLDFQIGSMKIKTVPYIVCYDCKAIDIFFFFLLNAFMYRSIYTDRYGPKIQILISNSEFVSGEYVKQIEGSYVGVQDLV